MRVFDNSSEFMILTVCCSCDFADCSFTLGSASPNNTAGTNALKKIDASNLINMTSEQILLIKAPPST